MDNLIGHASTTLLDRTPYYPGLPMKPDFDWGTIELLKKKALEDAAKKQKTPPPAPFESGTVVIGTGPDAKKGRFDKVIIRTSSPEPPAVEMYQAGTGAVRSSDLKKERWDLLSGAAFLELRRAMTHVNPGDNTVQTLVEEAVDYMFRFLGCWGERDHTGCSTRLEILTKGWAWLACALDLEAGHSRPKGMRYPLEAMRRTAMACKEGEVKYGEENWLNGFRLKILCNHALKHMVRYTNGVIEDDELGHASWGFMAATHMMLFRPDMCDLLAGENYTITDELREYHKNHLSRKQVKA